MVNRERKQVVIREGTVSKGGQNPAEHDSTPPPPPVGSGTAKQKAEALREHREFVQEFGVEPSEVTADTYEEHSGSYEMRYNCRNCGYSGEYMIPFGQAAPLTVQCRRCGCDETQKIFERRTDLD